MQRQMLRLKISKLFWKGNCSAKQNPCPPNCGNQKHSAPKRHTSARRCIRLRSRLIGNCWRCRRINQVYSFAFASSEHFGMICAGMLGSHAAEFGKMPTDGFVPQSKFFSIFGQFLKTPTMPTMTTTLLTVVTCFRSEVCKILPGTWAGPMPTVFEHTFAKHSLFAAGILSSMQFQHWPCDFWNDCPWLQQRHGLLGDGSAR